MGYDISNPYWKTEKAFDFIINEIKKGERYAFWEIIDSITNSGAKYPYKISPRLTVRQKLEYLEGRRFLSSDDDDKYYLNKKQQKKSTRALVKFFASFKKSLKNTQN